MRYLLLFILLCIINVVNAQIVRPFSTRYQNTFRGNMVLLGNTNLTFEPGCGGCAAELPPAGTGRNNNFNGSYLDADTDASTLNSSAMKLEIPDCSEIAWAGLYWQGRIDATAASWVNKDKVKFKMQGDPAYTTITADVIDNSSIFGTVAYHCFKDITPYLANATTDYFWVADVLALTGSTNNYSGWSLLVIYKNDTYVQRNFTVNDGLANISSTTPLITIPISGFITPPSGAVNFDIGTFVMDGDRASTGDSMKFQGGAMPYQYITNATNPINDVFNSTITSAGSILTDRIPSFNNTMGIDVDLFTPNNVAKNFLGNSMTSANVQVSTGGETFYIQYLATAIDTYDPTLDLTSTITDNNGGSFIAGDTLTITSVISNLGSDLSLSSYYVDTLPYNLDFLTGSLEIIAGAGLGTYTDAIADDLAYYDAANRIVRYNIGAAASMLGGGTLNVNETMTLEFQVIIKDDCLEQLCANNSVSNYSWVVYEGNLSGSTFVNSSRPTGFDANGCKNLGPAIVPILPVGCVASFPGDTTLVLACGTSTYPTSNLGVKYPLYSFYTLAGTPIANITTAGTYRAIRSFQNNNCVDTSTITVSIANCIPVANNNSGQTNPGVSVNVNIVSNDTDSDGTILASSVDLDPSTPGIQTTFSVTGQGTYSVNASGVVNFMPAPSFSGSATPINYTVNDNSGATSNIATISIYVNIPPVVVNVSASTLPSTSVMINLTTTSTDSDGTVNNATYDLDPSTPGIQNSFTVVGQGSYNVNASGVVTFLPVAGFNGNATPINYNVLDDDGTVSNNATISIYVAFPPVANNNSSTTNEDVAVTFNISSNDSDVDGTIVSGSIDLNPSIAGQQTSLYVSGEGTYTVNASGNITFTPDPNYNGTSSITYTILDNDGLVSNQATVSVTIVPVNDPPVAVDNSGSTSEEVSISFVITGDDYDIDGSVDVSTVDLDPITPGIQTSVTLPQGTVSVDALGEITYLPATNYNGIFSLTYIVFDNDGQPSNAATIDITVTGVNDPPVTSDDSNITPEDTPITFYFVGNDNDIDGTLDLTTIDLDPSTPGQQTTVYVPGQGTFSIVAAGFINFSPDLNFFGSSNITYTVLDNNGLISNISTVTINVLSTADSPVATNNNTTTPEGVPVTYNVSGDDTDPDGTVDPTTIDLNPYMPGIQSSYNFPGIGLFTVDAAGNITLTPTPYYNGTATINYTINDNDGNVSNIASFSVVIVGTPTPPVANNNSSSTPEDTPVSFNIIANDSDLDGTLQANSVDLDPSTPGQQTTLVVAGEGTYTVDAFGLVTFVPVAGYSGVSTIQYVVFDNESLSSNIATISVAVNFVNDPPTASDNVTSTLENTSVILNISGDDNDIDGTIDNATIDLDPSTPGIQSTLTLAGQGTVSVDAAGNITFIPNLNYNGIVTFTYTVNDNLGLVSNIATVTIDIQSVNIPPVTTDNTSSTLEEQSVTFNISSDDNDSDGSIILTSIDLDPSNPGIQTTFTSANGVYTVDALGNVTFTPNPDFYGVDVISYSVLDNEGAVSNVSTITINVTHVNFPPVASNNTSGTLEDTPVTFNIIANDYDVDGNLDLNQIDLDPSTPGIQNTVTVAGEGTYTVDGFGNVTFTPDTGFNGVSTIDYVIYDTDGIASNMASISVTVPNVTYPPVATDNNASINEGGVATVNIVSDDSDTDGVIDINSLDLDPSMPGIQHTVTTAEGTFTYNPSTGELTFVPNAGFYGTVSLDYFVYDNDGLVSNIATVTIEVIEVIEPPIANNNNSSTLMDTPVSFNISTNDNDPDGSLDLSTIDLDPSTPGIQNTITTPQGTWTVDASGNVTFNPALGFYGVANIDYVVSDNDGNVSNVASISVDVTVVTPTPIAPVANDNTTSTTQGSTVTINITSNDSDADGSIDPSTIDLDPTTPGQQTTLVLPGQGTFSVDALGNVTFIPDPAFVGSVTIYYSVMDNTNTVSNIASININVSNSNLPPNINNDISNIVEGETAVINIVNNDNDPDNGIDLGSFTILQDVQNGSITYDPITGQVTYVPDAGFIGVDSFQYQICDNGTPMLCNTAWVYVNVTAEPFDYSVTSSIGGSQAYVWYDENNNGLIDAGENTIPNVIVYLYSNAGLDQIIGTADDLLPIGFTYTNSAGQYQFDNQFIYALDGTLIEYFLFFPYTLNYSGNVLNPTLSNVVSTLINDPNDSDIDINGFTLTFNLDPAASITNINAGYVMTLSVAIDVANLVINNDCQDLKVSFDIYNQSQFNNLQLQYSIDGQHWNTLHNFDIATNNYNYKHETSMPLEGLYFVRLAYTNNMGSLSIVKTVAINYECTLEHNLLIYPQPVSNIVNIEMQGATIGKWLLIDVSGKLINSGDGLQNHKITIDMTNVATGMYLLGLQNQNEYKYYKIEKQ